MMKHIYIAGPYSHGFFNVLNAIDRADKIQVEIPDVVVFLPHLYHFWASYYPHHDEEFWLDIDLAWLSRCDCIYRMPGDSDGADMEVAKANELGLPVFYNMIDLIKWSKEDL
jgi:hypothetical protein